MLFLVHGIILLVKLVKKQLIICVATELNRDIIKKEKQSQIRNQQVDKEPTVCNCPHFTEATSTGPYLMSLPQWGTADAEMKTPLPWWEPRAIKGSLFLNME